jgi:hypothetical protein
MHAGQITRTGESMIEHLDRIASFVPEDLRALAYLHDVLERVDGAENELAELMLNVEERAILDLLTRGPEEPYRTYVMRIARARGRLGRAARTIKLADLDDHLRHRRPGGRGAPNYEWARQQIVRAQRLDLELPGASGGLTLP